MNFLQTYFKITVEWGCVHINIQVSFYWKENSLPGSLLPARTNLLRPTEITWTLKLHRLSASPSGYNSQPQIATWTIHLIKQHLQKPPHSSAVPLGGEPSQLRISALSRPDHIQRPANILKSSTFPLGGNDTQPPPCYCNKQSYCYG